jgi:hypothetical protein
MSWENRMSRSIIFALGLICRIESKIYDLERSRARINGRARPLLIHPMTIPSVPGKAQIAKVVQSFHLPVRHPRQNSEPFSQTNK